MNKFFVLLRKELRAFFCSPTAYLIIALFMVIGGLSFRFALGVLERSPTEGSLVRWTFGSTWFWLLYFPIFPLITMRLFSEEKKLGTLEPLLTAPVRLSQVILAKYLAALIFYLVLWSPSLLNFLIFEQVTGATESVPRGQLLGSILILLASGCFYLAIGCFASSLCSNQIIAAVICFCLCLMHFLLGIFTLGLAENVPPLLSSVVSYFTTAEHFQRFTAGLIDTRAIVYYLSGSLLLLLLTRQVLEYRRLQS